MKQIPLEHLHDEMMKEPQYRRLYESDQRSKAYEERENLLRELTKMVTLDRLRELVAAERDGRVIIRPSCDGCDHEFTHWAKDPCYSCYGSDAINEKGFYYKRRAEAEAKGEQK